MKQYCITAKLGLGLDRHTYRMAKGNVDCIKCIENQEN